jgi:hypothetical protein
MTTENALGACDFGVGRLNCGLSGPIRSYDHRGVVFSWEPPDDLRFRRAAIDVEAFEVPSIRYMSAHYALSDIVFLRRWTATEVIAKVLNVPILELLKHGGLVEEASHAWSRGPHGVWMRELEYPYHCVTVGLSV